MHELFGLLRNRPVRVVPKTNEVVSKTNMFYKGIQHQLVDNHITVNLAYYRFRKAKVNWHAEILFKKRISQFQEK